MEHNRIGQKEQAKGPTNGTLFTRTRIPHLAEKDESENET